MPTEEKTNEGVVIKPLSPISLNYLKQELVLATDFAQKNDPNKIYLEKMGDYELLPMSALPMDKKPLKGKIYLEKKPNALEYCLLNPKGEIILDRFIPGELLISQNRLDVLAQAADLSLDQPELKKAILQKNP